MCLYSDQLSPFEMQAGVIGWPDLSPARNLNKNVQTSMQATQGVFATKRLKASERSWSSLLSVFKQVYVFCQVYNEAASGFQSGPWWD